MNKTENNRQGKVPQNADNTFIHSCRYLCVTIDIHMKCKELHVKLCSCKNQQMHTTMYVQLYIIIHFTDMFLSHLWLSSGCRTIKIQEIDQ